MANGIYNTSLLGTPMGVPATPTTLPTRMTTFSGTTTSTPPQVSTPMPNPMAPTMTTPQVSTVMPNPFYQTIMQKPELVENDLSDRSATIYIGSLKDQMAKYAAEIEKINATNVIEYYENIADIAYNTLYPEYAISMEELERTSGLSKQSNDVLNASQNFSFVEQISQTSTTISPIFTPTETTNVFSIQQVSTTVSSMPTPVDTINIVPINSFNHSIMNRQTQNAQFNYTTAGVSVIIPVNTYYTK